MRFNTFVAPALIAAVTAYPGFKAEDAASIAAKEDNCGLNPCTKFDKNQFQDVRPGSGHEFIAPQQIGGLRGPCPGLNAMANHGFISRTGILDFEDTVEGIFEGLGLSREFNAVLFVFSVFNSGSFIDMKWSIGGPIPGTAIIGKGIGQGLGISNSHNKYEGDASTGRGDAYLHNGDAHSLNIPNYTQMRSYTSGGRSYSMQSARKHQSYTHEYTRLHNPYGFFGPGFFVPPIAHQFVVVFMSNHSEENPGGFLERHVMDSFFSVKEQKDGSLKWIKGHDRMPENWYRRPRDLPYGIESSFGDLGISCALEPAICDIGGNMGKPGDYVGIEVEDLTGGVFNAKDLLSGNNLACFAIQGLVIATPDAASGLLKKLTPFEKLANKIMGGTLARLSCPQLTEKDYKMHKFDKYPGFQYEPPIQGDTPY